MKIPVLFTVMPEGRVKVYFADGSTEIMPMAAAEILFG